MIHALMRRYLSRKIASGFSRSSGRILIWMGMWTDLNFNILALNFGKTGVLHTQGDADYDGDVDDNFDVDDLLAVQQRIDSATASESALTSQAVDVLSFWLVQLGGIGLP